MRALPRPLPFAWLCGVRPIRISAELSSNVQAKLRVPYGSRPSRGPDRRGGGKRIRVAPSDRGPSRRQRARPPLSTGRPDPFPSPTPRLAGAVWQPCHRIGQEKRLAASAPPPDAGQIIAGLNAPASPPGLDREQQLTACPIDVNPFGTSSS